MSNVSEPNQYATILNENSTHNSIPQTQNDSSISNVDSSADSDESMKRRGAPDRTERRKNKKQRKKAEQRIDTNRANKSDYTSLYGQQAAEMCAELVFQQTSRGTYRARDLQSLLLWAMCNAVNLDWLFIKHLTLVDNVVVIIVDGLTRDLVKKYQSHLTCLQFHTINKGEPLPYHLACSLYTKLCAFQHTMTCTISKINGFKRQVRIGDHIISSDQPQAKTFEVTSSSSSSVSPIFVQRSHEIVSSENTSTTPSTKSSSSQNSEETNTNDKSKNAEQTSAADSNSTVTPSTPLLSQLLEKYTVADIKTYCATQKDLLTYGFPTPLTHPSFTPTKSLDLSCNSPITDSTPVASVLIAIDCEMVMTANGFNLARVTMVDIDGNCLLDTIVKPLEPVTDYLTEFSGITKEILDNATDDFAQAQAKVLALVSSSHIIVGHSVENDLRVLNISHPLVLDTSLLFPHQRGGLHKSSLKYLAGVFLKEQIQNTSTGHDSYIDAHIAMRLAVRKILGGPTYGIHMNSNILEILSHLKIRIYLLGTHAVVKRYSPGSCNSIPFATLREGCKWVSSTLKRLYKKSSFYARKVANNGNIEDEDEDDSSENSNDMDDATSSSSTTTTIAEQEEPLPPKDSNSNPESEKNAIFFHAPYFLNRIDMKYRLHIRQHLFGEQSSTAEVDSNSNTSADNDGDDDDNDDPTSFLENPGNSHKSDADSSSTASTPSRRPITSVDALLSLPSEPDFTEEITELNTQLLQLWNSFPPNTLFVLASGQGSNVYARCAALQSQILKNSTHLNATSFQQQDNLTKYLIDESVDTSDEITEKNKWFELKSAERNQHSRLLLQENSSGILTCNVRSYTNTIASKNE